jgi:hypothetical protein
MLPRSSRSRGLNRNRRSHTLSLSFLFWATLVIAFISFWWQSDKVKATALRHVYQYCKQQSLQVLDQTMVLNGLWFQRNDDGAIQLRRRYVFEFTSTGEERYRGSVEISGNRLQRITLPPHILPEVPQQLH